MAGVVEVVASAWNDWALQALVLLSFTLQVSLLVLAELRRRVDSSVLRAVVWSDSVYMVADGTAIYVLGHLPSPAGRPRTRSRPSGRRSCCCCLRRRSGQHHRLRHRGQPAVVAPPADACRAGGRRRLRPLQLLHILGGPPLLRWAAILVFLAGAVKYGERVWALRCAGSSVSGSNYRAFKMTISFAQAAYHYQFRDGPMAAEDLLLVAHLLLHVPINVLKGPFPEVVRFYKLLGDGRLHGEEAYEMIEMQLSLMHDVFYTKAEVKHTWYGRCIRMISLVATIVAFVLFSRLLPLVGVHKTTTRYGEVDIAVTHVLLLGALVLEITSVLRATFSSWTSASLIKSGNDAFMAWRLRLLLLLINPRVMSNGLGRALSCLSAGSSVRRPGGGGTGRAPWGNTTCSRCALAAGVARTAS
ncbi:unnamed protein product [Urochloa humidicola]